MKRKIKNPVEFLTSQIRDDFDSVKLVRETREKQMSNKRNLDIIEKSFGISKGKRPFLREKEDRNL